MNSTDTFVRSGIVLTAGDGKRLQLFVQQLRGDLLRKQWAL